MGEEIERQRERERGDGRDRRAVKGVGWNRETGKREWERRRDRRDIVGETDSGTGDKKKVR